MMEFPDAVVALVSAIIGGAIAGYYTLKATDKAIRDQNEKENRSDEKEVQNLLDALGVEIKTLWDFHMKRVGQMVEELPDGKPLAFYYPLTQDYFTIYNSNANLIGRIKDCDVSEAIVVCYNKCKKVVDGFKYNNELYREYRAFAIEEEVTPSVQAHLKAAREALVAYALVVKEDHFELKGYVERLLAMLRQPKPVTASG